MVFQLTGKYERDEIWKLFTRRSGSKSWPSQDPKDTPYDIFCCNLCGKAFQLLMYGQHDILGFSFEEKALVILAEHLNMKH